MGHHADEYDQLADLIVFEDKESRECIEAMADDRLAWRIAAILREHFESQKNRRFPFMHWFVHIWSAAFIGFLLVEFLR